MQEVRTPDPDAGLESLVFRVQGSDTKPYTVTFTRSADTVSATCDCLAGRAGKGSCKHRLRLVEGSTEGITCGNVLAASQVAGWLAHCERGPGLRPAPAVENARARRVAASEGVVFTGFARAARTLLEAQACASGLRVCKSVDKACLYVVAGPNAGPAKLAKARAEGLLVITEQAFVAMIQTGELPQT